MSAIVSLIFLAAQFTSNNARVHSVDMLLLVVRGSLLEFMVLQVVPHFFVRIPIRRVSRQMKHMQSRLARNILKVFWEVCGGA